MIEKLTFTIKGKTYTTEEVTVGRMVDLWRFRNFLSNGSYGSMYRFAMDSADEAILMIDIEAFFSAFCPKLLEDLKPTSVREMGLNDYMELKEIYQEQIEPWMKSVEDLLKKKKDV